MSNLDVYCVSHFDEKQLFAHMGELRLTLDPKDFATNGYQVDERQHPRTASKSSGRKVIRDLLSEGQGLGAISVFWHSRPLAARPPGELGVYYVSIRYSGRGAEHRRLMLLTWRGFRPSPTRKRGFRPGPTRQRGSPLSPRWRVGLGQESRPSPTRKRGFRPSPTRQREFRPSPTRQRGSPLPPRLRVGLGQESRPSPTRQRGFP